MSADRPGSPGPGPGQALASIGSLTGGLVSAVVMVTRPPGHAHEVAELRPTEAAAAALADLVRSVAADYAHSEAIPYEPAGSPADGQVMWVGIGTVPLLRQILDDSADLAAIPLFDPGRAQMASLRLAAARVDNGASAAVFVQSIPANQVVARSRKVGLVLRRGVLDVPDDELLLIGRNFVAVLAGDYAFFQDRRGSNRSSTSWKRFASAPAPRSGR